VMVIGSYLFFTSLVFQGVRNEILQREARKSWVKKLLATEGSTSD